MNTKINVELNNGDVVEVMVKKCTIVKGKFSRAARDPEEYSGYAIVDYDVVGDVFISDDDHEVIKGAIIEAKRNADENAEDCVGYPD